MARSFKELGKESSELIEQGRELESRVQQCKVQIQSAAAAVASARQNLEHASQVDEEGNSVGDVSEANARLSVAQNQLAASQRALQRAQQAVDKNNQQKRLQIEKIEQHNKTSRANISRLGALSGLAFSENVSDVQQGLIERYNEIEQARVALLESMGEKASSETIQAPSLGNNSSKWSGVGFGALDLQGEEQSIQRKGVGSATQGQQINNSKDGFINTSTNGIDSIDDGTSDLKNDNNRSQNNEIVGDEKRFGNSKLFSGFEVDKHINGSDYFVKGSNYEQFKNDYYSTDDFTYRMLDNPKTVNVSPSLIEGIHLSEYDVNNPSAFWSQHMRNGSQASFREIARHIPEVREQLSKGKTIDDLLQDPDLGTCTQIYFVDKTRVVECDGYYEFDSNGRHRILAARELGYEIPVEVIARKEHGTNEIAADKHTKTAEKLLESMPRWSDFNSKPNESINNSLKYNSNKYGKDSSQYQSFLSRSLDPLRSSISYNERIAKESSRRFEELYSMVGSDFKYYSAENKAKVLTALKSYQTALKAAQADLKLQKEQLHNQALKIGLNEEHINTRFIGFNGTTDIFHACDNVITSRQTGGTCGINSSVSCENQVLGITKTQYDGFKAFSENHWCTTNADSEGKLGGTSIYGRQDYLKHQGLDCETKEIRHTTLDEMCGRLKHGESMILTVHAQDLNCNGLIDSESRKPHIVERNGRYIQEINNGANHAVNVVGFEVNDKSEVASIYINDTGGWNDYTDENGNPRRVNLIAIPIKKFSEMCKKTENMFVQFVKKRG